MQISLQLNENATIKGCGLLILKTFFFFILSLWIGLCEKSKRSVYSSVSYGIGQKHNGAQFINHNQCEAAAVCSLSHVCHTIMCLTLRYFSCIQSPCTKATQKELSLWSFEDLKLCVSAWRKPTVKSDFIKRLSIFKRVLRKYNQRWKLFG